MSGSWCSVPFCNSSKKKCPHLSFHDFPANKILRACWVRAIRRDEGPSFVIIRGSTYVCSEHFKPEDLHKPTQTNGRGRTRVKYGAVPSKFLWNGWGSQAWKPVYQSRQSAAVAKDHDYGCRPFPGSQVCLPVHQQAQKHLCAAGLDDCAGMAVPGDSTDDRGQVGTVQRTGDSSEDSGQSRQSAAVAKDHNYDCRPFPGKLDGASGRIQEVELNVISLKIEPEQMKAGVQQPLVHQFCFTDNNFRFYTKFISKEVFTQFWKSIEPSASNLVYWSEAQRTAQDLPTCSPCGELALIDEFFVFLCRVAAGFHERTLSKVFKVSQSTVSRIILTWTNYLYLVLGSLPLWMTREQVQSAMSDTFKLYYPEVRVIIDCAEIKCETPSSLSPQSETSSSCKNHTTLKGLIGISPCGAVTFVSKLFTGSISDVEITQRSQLLQLLEPGDGVVADKGFLIKKMLSEVGAKLIVPPLKKSAKLSMEGALRTQAITRLRILSERAIRRVKEYHIWDGPVPLPMAGSVNKLWSICCIMSNFMGPLDVKGDKPI